MSLEDCTEALRTRDPERFGICLLVPATARPRLLTLYALNLELARAPLASNEPLIAEIRLQWWIERLEEIGQGRTAAHELLTPLAEAWGARASALAALAEGRRRDAEREPHEGSDAVIAYVRDTAVPLALFGAEALGTPAARNRAVPQGVEQRGTSPYAGPSPTEKGPPDLAAGVRVLPEGAAPERSQAAPGTDDGVALVIAAQAEGMGLAHWLAALPALQGRGLGLRDPSPGALGRIAAHAWDRLAEARAQRRAVPRALAPVLFPGAGVRSALEAAPKGIEALAAAQPSEFRKRLALTRFALIHRWWI